ACSGARGQSGSHAVAGPALASSRSPRQAVWNGRGSSAALLQAAELPNFKPADTAALLHRLQLLPSRERPKLLSDRRFERLVQRLELAELSAWRPKDLSLACHALAKLQIQQHGFLSRAALSLAGRLEECSPQDIGLTLGALGKLRVLHQVLPLAVAGHVESIASRRAGLNSWTPQELSSLLHSFGLLGLRPVRALAALATVLPLRLHDFKGQDLSESLWAFARLEFIDDALLLAAAEHLQKLRAQQLRGFSPQALSNCAYAFGVLGFRHEGALQVLAAELGRRLESCNDQDISNAIYAFALLEFRHPGLLAAVSAQLVPCQLGSPRRRASRLADFAPQALGNSVFALQRLRWPCPGLLTEVASQLKSRGSSFTAQDLVALASSCLPPGSCFRPSRRCGLPSSSSA
ncbi:unnamed protein product, partial [Polarella glacialis]